MEFMEAASSDTVSPKQNAKYCKKKGRIQTKFTKTNPNMATTLQQPSQTKAMPGSRKKDRRNSVHYITLELLLCIQSIYKV